MKIFGSLLVLFMPGLFISCGICDCKKTTCPAFSDPVFEGWFPYKTGDSLVFKTADNKETKFYIEVTRSGENEVNRGCFGGAQGCNSYCNVSGAEEAGGTAGKLNLSYNIINPFSGSVVKNTSFRFYTMYYYGEALSDTGMTKNNNLPEYQTSFHNSLSLDGRVFTQVQELVRDTLKNKEPGAFAVYFSKNNGVIGFRTFPLSGLWVKQN